MCASTSASPSSTGCSSTSRRCAPYEWYTALLDSAPANVMITYSKTSWGLHLLLRIYGSAFPRSLIFSIISTSITVALYVTKERQLYDDWRHPYPYHIFAFIVGFIVVFRCEHLCSLAKMHASKFHLTRSLWVCRSQLSYGRYWEGRLQLQTMTARWADFCTEVSTGPFTYVKAMLVLSQRKYPAQNDVNCSHFPSRTSTRPLLPEMCVVSCRH